MNKLQISSTAVEIHCDRNDAETWKLLEPFYPVHCNRLHTHFILSIKKLPEILKVFRGIDETNYQTLPDNIYGLYVSEMQRRSATTDLLTNGPKHSCVVNDQLTLSRHQQLGRELALVNDKYAFFYDTRTGKTPMSLSIINDDVRKNPTNKWVVVCPLILIENAWMEDAAKFFPDLKVVNCYAKTKDKRIKAINTEGNVYITNTESFVTYRPFFDKLHAVGAFVDESSDMKSYKSKISENLVEFAYSLKRFYLLSGTPAPNGEFEYYKQMQAIDYYGWPPNVTQFEKHFFVNISQNVQYKRLVVRPDRKEDLENKIAEHALYVDKEDVLDTPGRTFVMVPYSLEPATKDAYKLLKDKLYLEVDSDRRILASNAGVKLNKLNQVSSGFIVDTKAIQDNRDLDTDFKEVHVLSYKRFDKLMELLNSKDLVGQQVIIWANYRKEFEIIKQYLGDSCECIYGGTTIEQKNETIKKFKAGDLQYVVANPASADKGLTLTNSHIAVYFSLNWSYELFKQSYDRIYGDKRIQPNHCMYYILIAKGTVDRIIYEDVLQGKSDASYAILNHLKGDFNDSSS